MENVNCSDELQHHGIMGMKWGVRRYQNKDGSLKPAGQKRYNKEMEKLKKETAKVKAAEQAAANRKKTQAKIDRLNAKKQELEERKKALKEEKRGKNRDKKEDVIEETPEQRRERLLKSSDPNELYKYRDELSTLELNERINRIDTENRLKSKIVVEHEKTGKEYIEDAMGVLKTLGNGVSTLAKTPVGKVITKSISESLGIDNGKKYNYDVEDFLKNISSKSPKEINEFNQAQNNIDKLKGRVTKNEKTKSEADTADAGKLKKAQKEVDKYNKRWANGESDDKVTATKSGVDGEYRYAKNDPGTKNKDGSYSYNSNINLNNGKETVRKFLIEDKTLMSNASETETYSYGRNQLAGLLEGPVSKSPIDVEFKEVE